jgi:hypothetical protein
MRDSDERLETLDAAFSTEKSVAEVGTRLSVVADESFDEEAVVPTISSLRPAEVM